MLLTDIASSDCPLSSLAARTDGSMDCVMRSVFPFTRSSPYRVGGSSILYCAGGITAVFFGVGLLLDLDSLDPRPFEFLLTKPGVFTGVVYVEDGVDA